MAAFAPRRLPAGCFHCGEAIFGAEASYREVVAVEDTEVLASTRRALLELPKSEPTMSW